jgi:hypothetical protein
MCRCLYALSEVKPLVVLIGVFRETLRRRWDSNWGLKALEKREGQLG